MGEASAVRQPTTAMKDMPFLCKDAVPELFVK